MAKEKTKEDETAEKVLDAIQHCANQVHGTKDFKHPGAPKGWAEAAAALAAAYRDITRSP